jgi:NRAMP (natural resistance-associated macrophage protein)-like metal ion transporter
MVATTPSKSLIQRVGPGVITGAADDDPSGIATYSQAGAHAGFGLLWTVVLTWPLMVAVQSISARIGRVTGRGLAANMLRVFPRPVVGAAVLGLFVANTINIGADLAAMGAALNLLLPGPRHWYTLGFAVFSGVAIVFVPYTRYVGLLKWLTFSLLAYVGVVFAADINWAAVGAGALIPRFSLDAETLTLIVALLGTTISPYLFFWQSSQEVEEEECDPDAKPLRKAPSQAETELPRINWETAVGMGVSNMVAFFIMLTTAATLHVAGKTDIESTEQAAEALRPIAGEAAFWLFSVGIIGTGLLAVAVLAGSSAYAMGELRGWKIGLECRPREAIPFYGVIGASIVIALIVDHLPIDPMKALIWSAVLNGVLVVPVIGAMLVVASRGDIMGRFTATSWQLCLGWLTFGLMLAAAVAMAVLLP